ncbi:MAG TPA: hypothetical protein VFC46_12285 [Humisphaera sp.]|nr:hypothetical protein [Humisphaera sp.]
MAILVINEYDGLPLVGDTLSFSLGNGNIGAAWVNATTDSNGVAYMNVTGINVGDTPITVTDETHYAQGYGSVSVTSAPVTNITVGNANVNVGDTTQVTVSVTNADGTPAVGDGLNVSVGDGTIASAVWLNGNSTTDASGNATLVITGIAFGSTQDTVTDSHGGSGSGQISVAAAAPALQSLTATDGSDGSNSATATGTNGTANLFVLQDSSGSATINLSAAYTPASSGQLIPWTVNGSTASPASGDFSNGTSTVTLTPASDSDRVFTITAGNSQTGTETITVTVVNVSLVGDAPEVFENSYVSIEVTVAPESAASKVQLSIDDSTVGSFDDGEQTYTMNSGDEQVNVYGGNCFGSSGDEGTASLDAALAISSAPPIANASPTTRPTSICTVVSDAFSKVVDAGYKYLSNSQARMKDGISLFANSAISSQLTLDRQLNTIDSNAEADKLTLLQNGPQLTLAITQAAADLVNGFENPATQTPSNFQLDHNSLGKIPGYKPLLPIASDGTYNFGISATIQPTNKLVYAADHLNQLAANPQWIVNSIDFGLGLNFDASHKGFIRTGIVYDAAVPKLANPDVTASFGYSWIDHSGAIWSVGLNVTTHHNGDPPNQIVGASLTITPSSH